MKRKTLTILFVDLQGYTSRTARQTREENELLVQELKSFIVKHSSDYGGTFVKSMGDGFLLTFESPTDAIVCGQQMQAQIEQRNANVLNKDNFIRFRIGISTGEVNIDEDGDVYGDAVNIASRIQSFAEPNDVYISEATYLAMNKSEIHAMDLGPKKFKNALKEVRVYKVLRGGETIPSAPTKQKMSLLPLIPLIAGIISVALIFLILGLYKRKPDIEKLMRQKDYAAVVETAEHLLRKDPENLRIHELMVSALIKTHDYQRLKMHIKDAQDMLPDPRALCPSLIESLEQDGKRRMAMEIDKRHCQTEFQVDRRRMPQRFRQNRQEMRQDFMQQPFERNQENRSAIFDEPSIQEQMPDIERLLRERKYDEVIQLGEKQLEHNPRNVEVREMLSEAYTQMQDFNRAEELLREAYQIVPEAFHILFRIAEIHQEKGEFQEAIRTFQECAEKTPDAFQRQEALRRIEELRQLIRPEEHF